MSKHLGLIILFATMLIFDVLGNSLGGNVRLGLISFVLLLSVLTHPDRSLARPAALTSVIFGIAYGLLLNVNFGVLICMFGAIILLLSLLNIRNLVARNSLANLGLFNLWVLIFRLKGIYLDYLSVVAVNLVVGTILAVVVAYLFMQNNQRHAFK